MFSGYSAVSRQGPPLRKAEVKLAANFSHPAVTAEDRSLVGQICTLCKAAKSVISREWLCHSKEESSWLPEQEEDSAGNMPWPLLKEEPLL
ncbi:Peroxisomal multifunctional enzyme type 2 [Takifugu flavidus]|uniref:Peroxisomal multifunctional enzyme type 2 n=1 Tax=Takifugu flavidus TaxID=433684 RepID=A0A5C6N028_9TELE|nr:Peroxisomal multifunctional enzyme type 2 [Takifugu flavidus]